MARQILLVVFTAVSFWPMRATAAQKVDFGNFSGFDGTVVCSGQNARFVQDSQTFSIPYSKPDLGCSVTLKDGRSVSFVLGQELPGTFNSGLSVLVNIDHRFVLITLEGADVEFYSLLNFPPAFDIT